MDWGCPDQQYRARSRVSARTTLAERHVTTRSLFAEQIGFCFLGKRRFDHASACTTDTSGILQCQFQRAASRILMHGNETRHAVTFPELQRVRATRRALRRISCDVILPLNYVL